MYIRKTQIQKKKAGGHYFTYRIVESQRIGKKVSQRTLLNLGAEFSFSEEHVRKSIQPDPEQHKIYSLLAVKNHSGNVVKTTIATK